jgi:Ca-activated chloride channel family protein
VTQASLAHPEWLNAIVIAVLACAIALVAARRIARRRALRLLGERSPPHRRALSSDAALVIAGVAIALALLGPRVGERVVRTRVAGVDVVFLVDVSHSMDARDIPPRRRDRARRAVEEILARLPPGDRVGLAAFAGRGLLLAPLTPDHGALVDLLAALDSDLIEPASSNVGAGVSAALAAFEAGSDRPRVLVVASDGEDSVRRRDLGAEEARAQRVRVVTIALGSEAGGIVPDGERPLRDHDGEIVRSRRQRDRLAQLADTADGEAFLGDEWGHIDFARAAASVRRDAGTADGWIEQRIPAIGTAPFAVLAFALLLLEGLPRPPRRRRTAAAGFAAAAVLLSAGAHGTEPPKREGRESRALTSEAADAAAARVRARPDDARAQLELGLAHLAAGRNEAAMRAFQASSVFARSRDIAAVAYYDLGVAALAEGDLDTAREGFFAALDIDPSDDRARFNLEWTLRNAAAPKPLPDSEGVPQAGAADAEAGSGEGVDEASDRAPEIATMSDAQRRRWLERAEDDPRPWLRAAAAAPGEDRPRSTTPAW